jgi:hypothetical protein
MSERFFYEENDHTNSINNVQKYNNPPVVPTSGPVFELFSEVYRIANEHNMSAQEVKTLVADLFFIFEKRFNELDYEMPETVPEGGVLFDANEHDDDQIKGYSLNSGINKLENFDKYLDSMGILISPEAKNGGQHMTIADLKYTKEFKPDEIDDDNDY